MEEEKYDEWIKAKAVEIYNLSYYVTFHPKEIAACIRSLLKEYKIKGGLNEHTKTN